MATFQEKAVLIRPEGFDETIGSRVGRVARTGPVEAAQQIRVDDEVMLSSNHLLVHGRVVSNRVELVDLTWIKRTAVRPQGAS